ncbi:MAG: hypothetical protein ACRDFA_00065 [bacterium]
MPLDRFVDVAISRSQPAAEAAVARLRAAGIDAHLRETDSAGEPGVSVDVAVMVPSGQLAVAHELLRDAASRDIDEDPGLAISHSPPTPEVSAESLAAGLAQIRRRRLVMWFWFFSYLPAAVLVSVRGPASSAPVLALVWMAAYLASGILATCSRCPRCQGRFCSDGRRWNPYTQRCLNCQLSLRATQVKP